MFEAIRRWRQNRILATSAIPEVLWREALEALPFLAIYTEAELARLRRQVVLFLSEKSIVPARGFEVTPLMRAMIALQACVLTLNLDPRYYSGWENVIVYPDEFITGLEYEDEAGVVHRRDEPLAGEAVHGGPPLHAEMSRRAWQKTMTASYENFRTRVQDGENTEIDPYAAESPAEFFAVLSEVFFAEPTLLRVEYPSVYRLFTQFYRQDPASRTELLLED